MLRAVLEGGEAVGFVFLVLHLLVVAVAVGEIEGGVEAPVVGEEVRDIELVVALPVVVGLVGVVEGFAVHGVGAGGVVGGVGVEFVVVGAVPGDAGGLAADDGEELDQGALAVPTDAAEEALLVGAPGADVAVGGQAAIGEVEGESVLEDACTGAEAVLACVPASEAQVGLAVGVVLGVEGLHVDGGAKGRAAAVAGAHAALYLHALGHASEVGDVVPEHLLALGVVEGDAVDVDVDAAAVDAADAEGCGTHAAVLAAGHHGGLGFEHEGQAHRGAGLVELLAVHGTGGERCLVAHAHVLDHHFVQFADGVLSLES